MPIPPAFHALIVARPGAMRDAWRALLTALPHLRDIEQVETAPAALQAVARLRPALVVMDVNLLQHATAALLSQVRALSPETRQVVFVETVPQKAALAETAADMVLLQGAPAAEVAAVIENLLTGGLPAE